MENAGGPAEESLSCRLKKLLAEAGKALKTIAGSPRVVKLLWKTHPVYTGSLVLLSVIMGVLPILNLVIARQIVDVVSEFVGKTGFAGVSLFNFFEQLFSSAKLAPLIAGLAALELCQAVLQPVFKYLEDQLGDLLSHDIFEMILQKTNSLADLTLFETSEFYDNLEKAQQEASYKPVNMMYRLLSLARSTVTFLFVSVSLFIFQPFILLAVILFAVPNIVLQFKHNKESWALRQWEIPEVRRMHYYRHAATSKWYAAEIRMFNLGEYFQDKYCRMFREFHTQHTQVRVRQCRQNMLLGGLGTLADVGAYSFLALRTLGGAMSIGSFYFYSSVLAQVQSQLGSLVWSISTLYEDNLFLDNLFAFLDLKPTMVPPIPPGH
jgi:ATP-binding cassette, subfamily B, bacterial